MNWAFFEDFGYGRDCNALGVVDQQGMLYGTLSLKVEVEDESPSLSRLQRMVVGFDERLVIKQLLELLRSRGG